MFAALQNSTEISKLITVSDFKQGNVELKVKSINGVAIIPVVSERMKTNYVFNTENAGGFVPGANTKEIYMLVCPKSGAHLVKKTENMRIFTPEQNVDADAYKFDYRIYYDVFVKKSGLDAIWAWVSPEVTLATDDAAISDNGATVLSVNATSTGDLSYQWYACENESKRGAVKISGAVENNYEVDADLPTGTYYYFVRVTVDGIASTDSEVFTVNVE